MVVLLYSCRSLALLVFILATYFSTTALARHHRIRHSNHRHKRQHTSYALEHYVLDGEGPDTGAWSGWSEPSPCSRSCGGGVAHQTRTCSSLNPDGSDSCTGGYRRDFSCNIQDCPGGLTDFRAEQCSEFNLSPFEGRNYEWIPYTKADNKCELNCMPRGERFYYRHKRKVIDGTRCEEESLDVCVDGKCLPVGCDMILGSSAREDSCRECGGDSSSCNVVDGLLDDNNLQVGYNDILLIPAGATNIRIYEVEKSNNYLAIRNESGHYYLNGNWRIDFPRSLKFAGSTFHYERRPHGFFAPEKLTCLGPTTEAIFVVLLYQGVNPGVKYEYSIPKGVSISTDIDSYSWISDEFSECSSTCGGGSQTRNVSCTSHKDMEVVDNALCDQAVEPPRIQSCNGDPCPASWSLRDWGPCSVTCGEGGVQLRQVFCEMVVTEGISAKVDDLECVELLGPKPDSEQECNEEVVCPTWHVGPWKPCDHLCGEGQQRRKVQCFVRVDGKINVLEDSACVEKPEDSKSCMLRPCEGVDWVVSEWSGCEDKCSLTQETRKAFCSNQEGKVYEDSRCDKKRLPDLARDCGSPTPCEYQWYASQWSKCSAQCGSGLKTRKVFCGAWENETIQTVNNEKCEEEEKYEDTKNCTAKAECTGQWFSGPWSSCSKPCGEGTMSREIICLLNNASVSYSNCDTSAILFTNEPCNRHTCSPDEIMPMEPDKVTVSDDEEDCEEDEDGIIFMDTTIGLDSMEVTPISRSTEYEGSGGQDDLTTGMEDDLLWSNNYGSSSLPTHLDIRVDPDLTTIKDDASSSADIMLSDSTYETSQADSLLTSPTNDLTTLSPTSEDGPTSTEAGSGDDSTTISTSSSEDSDQTTADSSSETTTGLSPSSDLSPMTSDSSTEVTATSDKSSSESSTHSSDTSTDSTSDASDSTSDTSTDSTSDGSNSTSESSTDSTSESSTDSTSESSTDSTSESSTDSTSESSTDSTSESSTDSTSESSTDSTSPASDTSSDISSSNGLLSTSEIPDLTTASPIKDIPSEVEDFDFTSYIQSALTNNPTSSEESITSGSDTTAASSDETTASSVGTTASSDETTTSSDETTASSEGTTASSDETTVSSDETTASSEGTTASSDETTASSEGTTASSDETTSSSEGTTASSDETTASSDSTTASSDVTSDSTPDGLSVSSSQSSIEQAITKEHKMKKCKPRKTKKQCEKSEFGCCADGSTAAKGPFSKDCPMPMTCNETKHGCCSDGVSPAEGPNEKGCPPSLCAESLFGCCLDLVTAAEGNDYEGCPIEYDPTTMPYSCSTTEFGCCPDMILSAQGPNNLGCFECEGSGDCDTCEESKHGCCPDGKSAATGPDQEGCEEEGSGEVPTTSAPEVQDCNDSEHGCCPDGATAAAGAFFQGCDVINHENCTLSYFGCCPQGNTPAMGPNFEDCKMPCVTEAFGCCDDGISPAHGPNLEGCCLNSEYGCCPDNIRSAHGPKLEGCGCQYSQYGCCPDNVTSARGHHKEGCGCQHTPHGCCPNRYTPAAGPDFQGCPCYTYQFGCCPDGETIAKGPQSLGCGCENTEFGCCLDERTKALGPDKAGCGCEASKFGCCPNGVHEAQGNKFEGCENVPVIPGEACTEGKDRGTCRDFTVKWFFDLEYGGCSRFWYGGCEGNNNRFMNREECSQVCVEPPGRDACHLPKIEGPCEGYYPKWYYDSQRKQCGQFVYGGCLGNNNKFETLEDCQSLCVTSDTVDACEQPKTEGPCEGNFSRWYFDADTKVCQEFTYGGCKGNRNNFFTESSCVQQCLQPGRSREQDTCTLPALVGECRNYTDRWYFDSFEVRCRQFYYGGCGGNHNNFVSEKDCQRRCESGQPTEPPVQFESRACFLRDEQGPCNDSEAQWYYDSRDGVCKQFLYGGCDGNANRFISRSDCEQKCGNVQDLCDLPVVVGPCSGNQHQYYYDKQSDTCQSFDYGGCQGNGNKFNELNECEQRCKRGPPATTESPQPSEPPQPGEADRHDICLRDVDPGPCNNRRTAWYYSHRQQQCTAFVYGGCEGNANRFDTEEQCMRQCGTFKDQDVCSVERDVGPCRAAFKKYYYDQWSQTCEEFEYGGCAGSANRFSTQEECASVCLEHIEPPVTGNNTQVSNEEVCGLRVVQGTCRDGYYKRWYYDYTAGTCAPFIYTGCGGNLNNFKSVRSCLAFCTGARVEEAPPTVTAVTQQPELPENTIDVDDPRSKEVETSCTAALSECRSLKCQFGIERFVDEENCERCRCHDVCKDHFCPDGQKCAIELYQNRETGNTEYRAVCKSDAAPDSKPGECPLILDHRDCGRNCSSDSDCAGNAKCCSHNCGTTCIVVQTATTTTTRTPAPHDSRHRGPRIISSDDVVEAEEGSYATLRCQAAGNPTPTVTWRKNSKTIDGSGGRHKLLLDGSLQIIGIYRNDSGSYMCVADNGVEPAAQKEIRLDVSDGVDKPADIIGEPNTYVVVPLGLPASLQCYAVGWPRPYVTWWRGESMLPLSSELFEQRRDFSLLIRSISLSNLGPYTCQAYNGQGKAASWTITVQSVGPVYSTNPEDQEYRKFLVPPPRRPENETETLAPERPRPSYPYRPVRPVRPPPPPTQPEVRPPPDTPQVFIVPVQVNISSERQKYAVGSDISLSCHVDGHPLPRVVWYKNDELLESNDRIQITGFPESYRLRIVKAETTDMGTYRCEAANVYGHSTSATTIDVEGVYIHPNCTDNPFFANCQLIVHAEYCTHKYYARFCCKSCTVAGQLPSHGPHLDRAGTPNRP